MSIQNKCKWSKPCINCGAELDIEDCLIYNICQYCGSTQRNDIGDWYVCEINNEVFI